MLATVAVDNAHADTAVRAVAWGGGGGRRAGSGGIGSDCIVGGGRAGRGGDRGSRGGHDCALSCCTCRCF